MYCTLSFNRVQVQTLPTEQAAPALTDSFSRVYDPYTHACKARPPMTVGRTSLSVIVNSGLELFKIRQAHTLRTPPSPRQIADCIDEGKAANCFRLNRVFLWTTTCVLGLVLLACRPEPCRACVVEFRALLVAGHFLVARTDTFGRSHFAWPRPLFLIGALFGVLGSWFRMQ